MRSFSLWQLYFLYSSGDTDDGCTLVKSSLPHSFKANSYSALHNSNTRSDILLILGRSVHEVAVACFVQEPQIQDPRMF